MINITDKQYKNLLEMGWERTSAPSQGYICRVCHQEVVSMAWCSPKYSWYHDKCILNSSSFGKALKLADKHEN